MAAKMLKLTLAHCGQAIFINPLLIAGVCTPNPPEDEQVMPLPADYSPAGAYIYMAGSPDSFDVVEPAEQVAHQWQEIMNA